VGDFVVAVGNPFGFSQTVTSGIVSAVGRSGLPGLGFQNFIQTDASINPGNSGGALVNLRGELVGINTATFNPQGSRAGDIGLGFAIPANLAGNVMRQLASTGEVRRVTDGAPHDRRFWTADVRTRGDYARIRRDELTRALSLAGLEPGSASSLGVADLEAVMALGAIAQRVTALITEKQPSLVITHAYEGGHPDHDAASCGVWAATHLVARQGFTPPPIVEMALYHGGPGDIVVGKFLPQPNGEPDSDLEIVLDEDEKWRKQAMLDCFGSQAMTLMPFRPIGIERFRLAPEYDFSQPPHPGPLLYEQRDFPMTGATWRAQAIQTLRALDLLDETGQMRPFARKRSAGSLPGDHPDVSMGGEAQS
jgi:LmbE family N-acetylglucosaminyl deacetylase